MSTHQIGIKTGTARVPPRMVPISKIAAAGFPLDDYRGVAKVQRMQRSLRAGRTLKPVGLIPLTPKNRDKYGVTDPKKEHYLHTGHHRFAATALEGRRKVNSVDYLDDRKL